MLLDSNTILDLQLIQSNEVGGSYHMEKEGLKRSLDKLESNGLAVDYIVTDRHPQNQKFLRSTQFLDIWHFKKGLTKKLVKLSQRKDCKVLKKWLCSIKNHEYWSAKSSTSGPESGPQFLITFKMYTSTKIPSSPNVPMQIQYPGMQRNGSNKGQ